MPNRHGIFGLVDYCVYRHIHIQCHVVSPCSLIGTEAKQIQRKYKLQLHKDQLRALHTFRVAPKTVIPFLLHVQYTRDMDFITMYSLKHKSC